MRKEPLKNVIFPLPTVEKVPQLDEIANYWKFKLYLGGNIQKFHHDHTFVSDPYFKRYSNKGCRPDISLSFRGGVRDISFNRAAVYYTGVDVYNDTAFFKGSNRLLIWRYQNYDYRDKLQISFKFKPVPGPRIEPYTLVSNCEGVDEPSYGIVLNMYSNITTIFLKTYEIENQRFVTFDINVRVY